nr:AlNc14C70G4840 [Albugo laibachii Nc14]|eukprot:CCA19399.1 AlNc14C70G4840 [Albugo laibachii Nc14]
MQTTTFVILFYVLLVSIRHLFILILPKRRNSVHSIIKFKKLRRKPKYHSQRKYLALRFEYFLLERDFLFVTLALTHNKLQTLVD